MCSNGSLIRDVFVEALEETTREVKARAAKGVSLVLYVSVCNCLASITCHKETMPVSNQNTGRADFKN